jgi:hypothetical protein
LLPPLLSLLLLILLVLVSLLLPAVPFDEELEFTLKGIVATMSATSR